MFRTYAGQELFLIVEPPEETCACKLFAEAVIPIKYKGKKLRTTWLERVQDNLNDVLTMI